MRPAPLVRPFALVGGMPAPVMARLLPPTRPPVQPVPPAPATALTLSFWAIEQHRVQGRFAGASALWSIAGVGVAGVALSRVLRVKESLAAPDPRAEARRGGALLAGGVCIVGYGVGAKE